MDAKIEEKRKKDEENDNLQKDTLRKVQAKKRVEENKKMDMSKNKNKKQK